MIDFLEKFPEIIKSLLERVSQTNNSFNTYDGKMAREKLIKQLHNIMDELGKLSKSTEPLTEKQIEKLKIPISLPQLPKVFQNKKKTE